MSDQHKGPSGPNQDGDYSVEEILAEYGSGKYASGKPGGSKVVAFSQSEPDNGDSRPKHPDRPPAAQVVGEIMPKGVRRNLAARLSTLLSRADHYADHMYDQAEPDTETVKAEKYVPGVDQEREPPRRPRPAARPPKPRKPEQMPPDIPPAQLAAQLQKGLNGMYLRKNLALLCALACAILSIDLPFFTWTGALGTLPLTTLRQVLVLALMVLTALACYEVFTGGLGRLLHLQVGPDTLAAIAWLFTALDSVHLIAAQSRPGLSCGAVISIGVAMVQQGNLLRRRGDRISAKTLSRSNAPYVVTLDEQQWSGLPAYAKWSGTTAQFGSQLQDEDGAQKAYRIAAPLLLLGALLCAVMASLGRGKPELFVWCASCCLTAVTAWSATLSYAMPYCRLANRLQKSGAALAGWPGVERCQAGGILTTDLDLFPPGTVQVRQIKVFGQVSTEKVVAYTATLLRVLNCGLARTFHDLMRTQGALYREVSGVRYHEGGVSGVIRNQEILVGTAAFMHMMEVSLPQGLNIKTAVFCAIDGQLAGMFPLQYSVPSGVSPALHAITQGGLFSVLVTRDFNLIPELLERFKLPVDRLEFPPVERRLELSRTDRPHSQVPVALLCREGLNVFADAVVGGRRLRTATRLGIVFSLVGSVLGLALTFYLTSLSAWASLTTTSFLIFMLVWMVPQLLLSNWVDQF